ncbi:hypothetical protein DPMN_155731 [Dreissena polymorpha]|uniref:Uncharacterized protein n=1 Tax=Dreissena polymorpha TaxID=45954 RepID=A0A9D4FRR9_DREPO|nr:hypothetical protein DPMN_155731 [Dreissena polymorpha]
MNVFVLLQERDVDLQNEKQRQEENDQLRKQFAQAANAFHGWLTDTRYALTASYYWSLNISLAVEKLIWGHSVGSFINPSYFRSRLICELTSQPAGRVK